MERLQRRKDRSNTLCWHHAMRPTAGMVGALLLAVLVHRGAAAETSLPRFTLGLGASYLTTVAVPDGRIGADMVQGGLNWRYRFLDWFSIGGAIFAGTNVNDDGATLRSIRVEAITAIFDIPIHELVHPYMRFGIGVTSQSIDERGLIDSKNDSNYPYHTDGFFGVGAPGIQFFPLRWFHAYVEFQANVSQGGAPGKNDSSVQLGTELGVGFAF